MSSDIESLEARRDELKGRIKAIHRDLGKGLEKDYEEQAIQLENLEVLQEIARVAEIETAQSRTGNSRTQDYASDLMPLFGPSFGPMPDSGLMSAMRLHRISSLTETPEPLHYDQVPIPAPGNKEVLIKVRACGVCHTELDEIEGRTAPFSLPVIPGHQVTGHVIEIGANCQRNLNGSLVGVAWIYSSCGACDHCINGMENLCSDFPRACGPRCPGWLRTIHGRSRSVCSPSSRCPGSRPGNTVAMCRAQWDSGH